MARAHVDRAISALAATHCAGWEGSAAAAARERLTELAALATDAYYQVNTAAMLCEEALAAQAAALPGVEGLDAA